MEIEGVTFQSEGTQSFGTGDEITVVIFSGDDFTGFDPQNITPAGLATAPLITILYQETFSLPATIPNDNFLIIGFANPVNVDGGGQLGMMVFTNTEFAQREGTGNGGGRLLYRQGNINLSGVRDMRFSILGKTTSNGPTGGGESGSFNETGRLTLDGDFFHQPGAALEMQVAGIDNSNQTDFQFDQLIVDGTMTNGGALVVEFLPDYVPQNGDAVTLVQSSEIVGNFSSVTITGTPDGFEADVQRDDGDVVLTLTSVTSPLLGDVNRDGEVDFEDISPFIVFLANDEYSEEADVDQNGIVDFSDIGPFIVLLSM